MWGCMERVESGIRAWIGGVRGGVWEHWWDVGEMSVERQWNVMYREMEG